MNEFQYQIKVMFNNLKIQIMETIENRQCPNCWGYQEYNEENNNTSLKESDI